MKNRMHKRGASVPCVRGRAIRAEGFCESLGQCGPEVWPSDTRRARSTDPHKVAAEGGAFPALEPWGPSNC